LTQDDLYLHICEILGAMDLSYESFSSYSVETFSSYSVPWVGMWIFGGVYFICIQGDRIIWSDGREPDRVVQLGELVGEIRSVREQYI